MGFTQIILLAIAVGVWLIWYELRYGIQKRKEEDEAIDGLRKKWAEESRIRFREFSEARKDEKRWKDYLEKEGRQL